MKKVFISYSRKDSFVAQEVYRFLGNKGIPCWIDIYDIQPGTPYARAIMQGLRESSAMIVIYSKNTNDSDDILNEIDQAHSSKIAIYPFLLDDSEMSQELSYYLKRRQWIIAYPDFRLQLTTLFNALADKKDVQPLPSFRKVALVGAQESGRSTLMNAMNCITNGEGPSSRFFNPEPIQYGDIPDAEGNWIEINGEKGKIRLYDVNTDFPQKVIQASDAVVFNIDIVGDFYEEDYFSSFNNDLMSWVAASNTPILAIILNKADMLCDETERAVKMVQGHLRRHHLSSSIPIISASALGALNSIPHWQERIEEVIDIIKEFG